MGRNLTNLYISQSFQFLTQISGSELQTGLGQTLTGSLLITASKADTATTATTASYAQNATSASYALTASFALNAGGGAAVNTGSLMVTGSVNLNTLTFTKGDGSTFNLTVNTGSGGGGGTVNTGSLLVTASVSNATITYTKGDGSTFTNTINNVVSANTASYVLNAVSASFATNASSATSASFATNAANATSASFATTAATATNVANGINISASNISATNATFVSASIGYLQTITGSTVNIGNSFILLNTSTATRYAGILVEDSGSATPVNYTASLQFDSQTNDWFYEYSGSDPTNYGVAMFGPEYATKGSPTYLTNNRIPKGDGGHHLNDSSITDNGTTVSTTLPFSATQITASTGFLGNLTGTASNAISALTASKIISDGQVSGGNQYLLISETNPAGGNPLTVRTSNLVYDSTTNTLPTTASRAVNAINATSASFATSASYAVSSSNSVTSSFATTASYALNSSGVTGGEIYSYTFLLMGS
jgi:hypothetical protein